MPWVKIKPACNHRDRETGVLLLPGSLYRANQAELVAFADKFEDADPPSMGETATTPIDLEPETHQGPDTGLAELDADIEAIMLKPVLEYAASDAAKAYAKEHDVDLRPLYPGSGKRGRIILSDVKKALAKGEED